MMHFYGKNLYINNFKIFSFCLFYFNDNINFTKYIVNYEMVVNFLHL